MCVDAVKKFPVSAGVLLGPGLGAFFDGIVVHQLLQWHHMLSTWFPLNFIDNARLNIAWDGIFHSAAYVLVLAGLYETVPADQRLYRDIAFLLWGAAMAVIGLGMAQAGTREMVDAKDSVRVR